MNLVRLPAMAALLFLAAPAYAGTISPALQAQMDRTAPDSHMSIIVHQTEQAPIADISRELQIANATRQERHRRIVVSLQEAARSQEPLLAYLDGQMVAGSVLGYTSYWISNLTVVQATQDEIRRIAARPDVDWVEPNFEVQLITPIGGIPQIGPYSGEEGGPRGIGVSPGIRAVRAPEVWYQLGYTGAGRIVANLDTGVDGNHPALNTRWRGYQGQNPWQECWLDVLGTNTQFPTDTNSHGTHVMGTETGLGAATEDTVGVAWGAQWIACNAINQGVGGGFDQDVITAYQWFSDPDGNPNTTDDVPDVVQNSWRINESFGGNYTDCDTRWWNAIDNCEAVGVVTTWSAGNEGPGGTSIGSPPDRATTFYNATSVGAVDATNFGWPYPIAGFSSRGPTGCNVPAERKIKPEVVAPGVDVYSSVPGGGYSQSFSGTSMAGPHVAGIVGLLREANPNLDVDAVKQILMQTARDEGAAGEDNTYGWGFVDAYAAVVAATVGFGEIEGTITNASWNNTPLPGVRVKLIDIGNQFFSDANGHYAGSAPAGGHVVEASLASFRPDTAEVTLVANQVTIQDFALVDIAGPAISNVSNPISTTDTAGPYPIHAEVTDYSTVASVKLYYRLNGGVGPSSRWVLWRPSTARTFRGCRRERRSTTTSGRRMGSA
jgi:bacillopeptidase F